MDGIDDRWRGVKGVECRALGAVVFLGGQQSLQFFAEGLPAGILVAAADGLGEDGEGDRPEAGEPGKCLFFFRSSSTLLLLDGLQGADGGEDVAGLALFPARYG